MEYTFGHENKEGIRSDEVLNTIVNNSVREVVDTFNGEMTQRDKELLLSVTEEKLTPPNGRVVNLTQLSGALGASPELDNYVRQVFQTLQQELTRAEQKMFIPPFSSQPIFEIF